MNAARRLRAILYDQQGLALPNHPFSVREPRTSSELPVFTSQLLNSRLLDLRTDSSGAVDVWVNSLNTVRILYRSGDTVMMRDEETSKPGTTLESAGNLEITGVPTEGSVLFYRGDGVAEWRTPTGSGSTLPSGTRLVDAFGDVINL